MRSGSGPAGKKLEIKNIYLKNSMDTFHALSTHLLYFGLLEQAAVETYDWEIKDYSLFGYLLNHIKYHRIKKK